MKIFLGIGKCTAIVNFCRKKATIFFCSLLGAKKNYCIFPVLTNHKIICSFTSKSTKNRRLTFSILKKISR